MRGQSKSVFSSKSLEYDYMDMCSHYAHTKGIEEHDSIDIYTYYLYKKYIYNVYPHISRGGALDTTIVGPLFRLSPASCGLQATRPNIYIKF